MFRAQNVVKYPTFFNGAVPAFGGLDAELLIVGLAPGLKGANQTGRPFTGDYAGIVLYQSLLANGFATGVFGERADDGLQLVNARITNALRCVPQENKPTTDEIKMCNPFLASEINAMPHLKVIFTLGLISHNAVLRALGQKMSFAKFSHGAEHILGEGRMLINSYHCSRYNINTGRLTQGMFDAAMAQAHRYL